MGITMMMMLVLMVMMVMLVMIATGVGPQNLHSPNNWRTWGAQENAMNSSASIPGAARMHAGAFTTKNVAREAPERCRRA